jgi:hypothetical protein
MEIKNNETIQTISKGQYLYIYPRIERTITRNRTKRLTLKQTNKHRSKQEELDMTIYACKSDGKGFEAMAAHSSCLQV